jgi:glycosyltransferase involved in cell wall biosynthesis
MNVFMLTSVPMVPPWDQGDKNLAYTLTTALPHIRFRVITAQGAPPPQGDNLDLEPRYFSGRPSLFQKAQIFSWLFQFSRQMSSRRPPSNGVRPSIGSTKASACQAPDLYHLIYRPYSLSSRLLRLLPELKHRPSIHTVPATADGKSLERHMFFARHIVALSRYGQCTLQQLGVKNVIHIPPGIDVEEWAPVADQSEELKANLGLTGHPVLLFPGHYGPGQGSEIILEALPDILNRVPETRFIFACRLRSNTDYERERAVRHKIQDMGFTHAVRFYNTVADMRRLIGASDAILLPLQTMRAKVDIPTTLLEALAAAKPVIISDIPPMNELLARSGGISELGGLTIPPNDSHAFVEAVVMLLKNPELRTCMGACGQKLVRLNYDIRCVASQYEELYEEMAKCKQSEKPSRHF